MIVNSCYKQITIEEAKRIELNILEAVHSFCVSNNISYFVYFGSLIGAIRHNGFIPWDDDIDIVMPRDDYEKFCSSFVHEEIMVHHPNQKGYPYPFAKVGYKNSLVDEGFNYTFNIGINIDLFPLDKLPADKNKATVLLKRIKRMRKLAGIKRAPIKSSISLFRRVILIFEKAALLPFSFERLNKKINKIAATYNRFEDFAYYGSIVWGYKEKSITCKENLKPISHTFEHLNVIIPSGYDSILRENYGDYMQYPPEEQRIRKHGYNAFIRSDK